MKVSQLCALDVSHEQIRNILGKGVSKRAISKARRGHVAARAAIGWNTNVQVNSLQHEQLMGHQNERKVERQSKLMESELHVALKDFMQAMEVERVALDPVRHVTYTKMCKVHVIRLLHKLSRKMPKHVADTDKQIRLERMIYVKESDTQANSPEVQSAVR